MFEMVLFDLIYFSIPTYSEYQSWSGQLGRGKGFRFYSTPFGGKGILCVGSLEDRAPDLLNGHLSAVLTPAPNRDSRVPSEIWRTEEFACKVDFCSQETPVPSTAACHGILFDQNECLGESPSFLLS